MSDPGHYDPEHASCSAKCAPLSEKLPHQEKLPESYALGDRLRWDAPWVDVSLWAELPFWLMMNNAALSIEVSGHTFPVSTHDNYFELFFGEVTDSRSQVGYRGPFKKRDELSEATRQAMAAHPEADYMWRKCKTVVKIGSRCSEDVWNAVMEEPSPRNREGRLYIAELCRAHVPVLNCLVQNYRLATYDYFAFEVAPWDVPAWNVDRGRNSVSTNIVGYRQWDYKPAVVDASKKPTVYRLIDAEDLRKQVPIPPTPGELELLDALNLMERGDYSGAVRRVTTAIEVVVEHVVGKAIESAKGKREAEKFLSDTRMRFDKRVSIYQSSLVSG